MTAAQQLQAAGQASIDTVRRKYLKELHAYTKRNTIAYYSGWLSKPPNIMNLGIVDEDKNGFMMACHRIDKALPLDLILHTPGGSIAATESIVHYLRKIFKSDIRAIVPQIAMSAGTMIACSCDSIVLARHSNLGPIDPQVSNLPAHGVIEEFKRAYKEIKKDPAKVEVWRPILSKYPPTFLSQCENAIKWSDTFVGEKLQMHMFAGKPNAAARAKRIVKSLTNYNNNKTHSRHIHFDECRSMGLDVVELEADPKLQDLVMTVHHCYIHSITNTPSFKIIENHNGAAFVKQNHSPGQ